MCKQCFFRKLSINHITVIVQGKCMRALVPEGISWSEQLSRGSCSIIQEKCPGEKVQGGSCPGKNFMEGNCPRCIYLGRNYSGVIVRGAKVPEEFHMGQLSKGSSPGGIIQGYLSGGKSPGVNCLEGSFIGGNCPSGSCPRGSKPLCMSFTR